MKRPNSMRHLDDAIRRAANGNIEGHIHLRTLMANAVVAQIIPDGAIKGGSAIKIRFGNTETRFTHDLDTATAMEPELYAKELAAALEEGWEGFTGRVIAREPAHPRNVPSEYVMHPFDIKLSYNGKPWCTVPLEVGHNEIGDADDPDWVEQNEVSSVFEALGFPPLGKAPLMPLAHQVAQKIHAATGGGDRVRDLVDLQLIKSNANIDYAETKKVCVRLFAYRKKQAWPPTVVKRDGWDELYAEQSRGLDVLENVDDAIAWTNDLIISIDRSAR